MSENLYSEEYCGARRGPRRFRWASNFFCSADFKENDVDAWMEMTAASETMDDLVRNAYSAGGRTQKNSEFISARERLLREVSNPDSPITTMSRRDSCPCCYNETKEQSAKEMGARAGRVSVFKRVRAAYSKGSSRKVHKRSMSVPVEQISLKAECTRTRSTCSAQGTDEHYSTGQYSLAADSQLSWNDSSHFSWTDEKCDSEDYALLKSKRNLFRNLELGGDLGRDTISEEDPDSDGIERSSSTLNAFKAKMMRVFSGRNVLRRLGSGPDIHFQKTPFLAGDLEERDLGRTPLLLDLGK